MWLISILIFVINGALSLFSLNLVIKQKKRLFILHSIIYFLLSLISVYLYMKEYLIESIITFYIIGGITVAFDDYLLPNVIKRKNAILSYVLIMSLIISVCVFLFIK